MSALDEVLSAIAALTFAVRNTATRDELPEILGRVTALEAVIRLRLADPGAGYTPTRPVENINVQEGARRLGVSARYIYRRADSLPFMVRVGRRLLVNGAALEKYIQKRTGGT